MPIQYTCEASCCLKLLVLFRTAKYNNCTAKPTEAQHFDAPVQNVAGA